MSAGASGGGGLESLAGGQIGGAWHSPSSESDGEGDGEGDGWGAINYAALARAAAAMPLSEALDLTGAAHAAVTRGSGETAAAAVKTEARAERPAPVAARPAAPPRAAAAPPKPPSTRDPAESAAAAPLPSQEAAPLPSQEAATGGDDLEDWLDSVL